MFDVPSKQELQYSPSDWLKVAAEDLSMHRDARDLAIQLQSLVLPEGADQRSRYILRVCHDGISLQDESRPKTKPFLLDIKGLNRRSVGRDLLAKSVGRRCRNIVDATAGFGRDAFHLFNLGKNVIALERSPLIAIMLSNAINRLIVPSRTASLKMVCDDARLWLSKCDPPDVIYLDPMFPEQQDRSSLAANELRILRSLVGNDKDSSDLLLVARSIALQRVVVKRPAWAGHLGDAPDLDYKGRSVRYDIYLASL